MNDNNTTPAMKEVEKKNLYENGSSINVGDKVTTWGSQTVYTIAKVNGELVLEGVKPLSAVNCIPKKIL